MVGRPFSRQYLRQHGFTLIETLLAIAVLAILAGVSMSQYRDYRERVRVNQAKTDIALMSSRIGLYYLDAHAYPANLAEIAAPAADPWGRPYVYVDLTSVNGHGMARKDRKLNPLNSDYDLYSVGKDGLSKPQISNRESLDDVIRANDGQFIDLAANF